MMETLRAAWQSALAFLTPLWNAAYAFAVQLDPRIWAAVGAALLLFVLWRLLRRRTPKPSNRPEVLVSLGAISAAEGPDASGDVLLPRRFTLRLTVSNLNTYAVQVLEIALKTPEMDVPATAEVAAVVPPEGSVMLSEPLPDIVGEEGRLNLYFYTAGSKRLYRLQTSFALEPWNDRYKISPLNQSVAPSRQLASAGVSRVYERAWREQEQEGRQERAMPEAAASLPRPRERRAATGRTSERTSERSVERTSERATESPRAYPDEADTPRANGMSFPDEF